MSLSAGSAPAASGFVANTDFRWFSHFLHRERPPDEVNFWQPSPHGFKKAAGAPFFFRLGAPHKAVAGVGFFARYERVPVWLAWESFGDLNGTATFAEMTARIEAIRRRTGSALLARSQDYEVGFQGDWAGALESRPGPSRELAAAFSGFTNHISASHLPGAIVRLWVGKGHCRAAP